MKFLPYSPGSLTCFIDGPISGISGLLPTVTSFQGGRRTLGKHIASGPAFPLRLVGGKLIEQFQLGRKRPDRGLRDHLGGVGAKEFHI